ncbi:MAG: thioredoxin domain-containing protein [Chloroflexi bacterium]|nr:thioredoxin domain-containing protein [Chloroflexota bacterium]
MPNRLAHETSPYLLQHAENPVDWYPWGQEALQKARAEDKPIFLSIGYSACHWCHVMAHESFEDERTAAILNEHFVSIKVDREERPDIDRIYMSAVQAMTGHGGWPLSVFLTPDGVPFYGGTYFPPTPRHGLPAFSDVLLAIADAWRSRRQELIEGGQRVVAAIERSLSGHQEASGRDVSPLALQAAFHAIQRDFDREHGGWGDAPKFPQPMTLEFLLRYHHRTREPDALHMATYTLERMARGGLYDQIGGGFHRYCVDATWTVPHFEKMLYDNAQLARIYLHAWQVTGEPFLRTIAQETLDYVAREMADPAGGFYASQDADSEGEEGKFFLWTPAEIRATLGDEAQTFMAAYGVTERGNFEGKTILTFRGDWTDREALAGARRQLFEARERRVPPGRDEKVLTSWNGLMLASFAEAARVLHRPDYRQIAERNARFLLTELRRPDGRLWHVWAAGEARVNGYLDDYTHLIDGLLELYQTTFDPRWYQAAHELAQTMIEHFRAPVGFFDTSDDHEQLIVRTRELQNGAIPSGNAMAAYGLLRLAGLAVEPSYLDLARDSLAETEPMMVRYPLAFSQWLIALDYMLAPPREIAIVGDLNAPDTRALLEATTKGYRPHQMIAAGRADVEGAAIPMLQGRPQVHGRATAYVCTEFTCLPPITSPEALEETLAKP